MKMIIYILLAFSVFGSTVERYYMNIPESWNKVYDSKDMSSIKSVAYEITHDLTLEIIDADVRKVEGVKKLLNVDSNNFVSNLTFGTNYGSLYQVIDGDYIKRYIQFKTKRKSYLLIFEGKKSTYVGMEEELKKIINSFEVVLVDEEDIEAEQKEYYQVEFPSDWTKKKNTNKKRNLQKEVYVKNNGNYIEIVVNKRKEASLTDEVYWLVEPYSGEMHINKREEFLDELVPYVKLTYLYENKEKHVHYFLYNGSVVIEMVYVGDVHNYKKDLKEVEKIFSTIKLIYQN